MASILSYINYVLQQDHTFHGLQMRLLRIETVVTKLNEIKVFEVLFSKFCHLLRGEKVNR